MIDILLLSLLIVAKNVADTDDINEAHINIESLSIFEFEVEDLIVVEQVETAKLIAS